MELIFQNVQGRWIAEFELTADAAIHIEGVKEGDVSLWQRSTASGKYAFVRDSRKTPTYGTVYDYEIPALITPKFIKVECMTKPTFAEVISSGEITELKFQDKTVEVTNNGTTTITPDNGFAALNSVKVKTNVPQSGEGGGSASTVEYLDVRGLAEDIKLQLIVSTATLVKIEGGMIMTSGIMIELGGPDMVEAIAIIPSMPVKMPYMDNVITIGELIAEYSGSLPRLTEAEFYNLNA